MAIAKDIQKLLEESAPAQLMTEETDYYKATVETVIPLLKEAIKSIQNAAKKKDRSLLQQARGNIASAKEVLGTRMSEIDSGK
jgi:hypothetical protein